MKYDTQKMKFILEIDLPPDNIDEILETLLESIYALAYVQEKEPGNKNLSGKVNVLNELIRSFKISDHLTELINHN